MNTRGVTVFHTYRGGLFEEGRITCWFTVNPNDLEEPDHFDVRELRAWVEVAQGHEGSRLVTSLRRAIENGEIGGNEPC